VLSLSRVAAVRVIARSCSAVATGQELLFLDTLVSVAGCGDVFEGDVDVGELGAGQGGDVAVNDRAYSLQVQFDEQRLISDAGLMLTATLAQRLGIEELVNESVWLDPRHRERRCLGAR